MSVWMNKFTFPVFVSFPWNPHKKGNKGHTISCSESGIIYNWDIVEWRDHMIPMGRPQSETSPNMKTVGLMIWLMRSLWSTWKAVVTDSSFCALKGLSVMRKMVVYRSSLIKIGYIGLGGFTETVLMSTSCKKIGDVGCLSSEWCDT